MTFIFLCPLGKLISLVSEKKQTKHTSQEKGFKELSFPIIPGRGDFFFSLQVSSPSAYGADSSSFQLTVYIRTHTFALFFLCYTLEKYFIFFFPRKVESQHPCGYLLFFGIKMKMSFLIARKQVKPHLQTEAVQ